MILFNLLTNPTIFLGFILGILGALTIHETAHAWVANRLGDPTAKFAGRVSLNPLVHLDVTGMVLLFVAGFGWGKPVPINPQNLHSHWDEIKIALSGPLSNLLLATLLALIIRYIPLPMVIIQILAIMVQINLTLMIFNLLPIPPLDGSSILKTILPPESYHTLIQLSLPLLFAFIVFSYVNPVVFNFIDFVVTRLFNLLVY